MANVTVFEHYEQPDEHGDVLWPADVVTTVGTGSTVTLRDQTLYIVICADADCRVGFNTSAVASGMNILSAIPNPFKVLKGSGRTLQFV